MDTDNNLPFLMYGKSGPFPAYSYTWDQFSNYLYWLKFYPILNLRLINCNSTAYWSSDFWHRPSPGMLPCDTKNEKLWGKHWKELVCNKAKKNWALSSLMNIVLEWDEAVVYRASTYKVVIKASFPGPLKSDYLFPLIGGPFFRLFSPIKYKFVSQRQGFPVFL